MARYPHLLGMANSLHQLQRNHSQHSRFVSYLHQPRTDDSTHRSLHLPRGCFLDFGHGHSHGLVGGGHQAADQQAEEADPVVHPVGTRIRAPGREAARPVAAEAGRSRCSLAARMAGSRGAEERRRWTRDREHCWLRWPWAARLE